MPIDSLSLPTTHNLTELERAEEKHERERNAIGVAEDKYIYFLMATASAAIFVALQRTTQDSFHISQLPLGLAVCCWIVSFIAGCRNRRYDIVRHEEELTAELVGSTVQRAEQLVELAESVKDEPYPELSDSIRSLANELNVAQLKRRRKASESRSESAHVSSLIWYDYQFPTLILGGLFFLLWHLSEMWLRTQS